MGVFSELTDRRLVRIVGSAVAGGWVLLEATASFVERGLLSEVAYRVALVWYVGAILVSAVIGWHHGEKGHQRVKASEVVTLAVIAMLVLGGSVLTMSAAANVEEADGVAAAPVTLHSDRMVVAPLRNQTLDPSLDVLASMASDWITEGLHRTDLVDVVPSAMAIQAARFVESVTQADATVDPLRALGEETGARTVVSGSYYLIGDSIQFQLQVTDVGTGQLIGAPEPVTVPRARPADGLSELRTRVMGTLALGFDEQLVGHVGRETPPSFEAYQEFRRGMDAYLASEWALSVEHFQRAREIDPDFVLPLLYESFSRSNLGQYTEADSLVDLLAESAVDLNDHHRAWLRFLQAQFELDRPGALRAIRRAAEMAPGSKASYNAAWLALINNRPREALTFFDQLVPERGPMRGWFPYWDQRTEALHRVGEHEAELEAALEARRLYPERLAGLALHADALTALGRVDETMELVAEVQVHPGVDHPPCWAWLRIASDLINHGYDGEADRTLEMCVAWAEAALGRDPDDVRTLSHLASAYHDLGRYRPALETLDRFIGLRGERPEYLGWRAVLLAGLGRWDEARPLAAALDTMETAYQRPTLTLHQARVAALTGERERAVELVRRSFQEGLIIPRAPDRNFSRMIDYPPLVELYRPRG